MARCPSSQAVSLLGVWRLNLVVPQRAALVASSTASTHFTSIRLGFG
jgi:hypothetical protein